MKAKYFTLLILAILFSCSNEDSEEDYQNIPIDFQVPSNFPPLVYDLDNLSEYVFDLECSSLATHSEDIKLVGIGFCWEQGIAYYVPFNGNIPEKDILDAIRPSLENETIRKIGHNFKFDARLMNRFGINVRNLYFDTMIASFCLYGDRLKHNLDDLVLHHINHNHSDNRLSNRCLVHVSCHVIHHSHDRMKMELNSL